MRAHVPMGMDAIDVYACPPSPPRRARSGLVWLALQEPVLSMSPVLKRLLVTGSVLLNIVGIAAVSALYFPHYRAIPLDPEQLTDAIREYSWNSAGSWWWVRQDERGLLVEYRYHPFRFTRFLLDNQHFRLNVREPGMLSFDGCDITDRQGRCIRFRDLSHPDCNREQGAE